MSTTPREPLLSDEDVQHIALGYYTKEQVRKYHSAKELYNASYVAIHKARDIYEAARAKDAELIQMAVDLASNTKKWQDGYGCDAEDQFLSAAAAAGFKPSGE